MKRIKIRKEVATYHVISRVVAGERLLKPKDREVFRKQMRQMAAFCGVEVETYCILSNHFHLLVRVPPQTDLADKELVRRYAVLYGKSDAKVLEKNLRSPGLRDPLRKGLLKRMNDLSFFVKELKLRYTLYYNRTHKRFGTLWAEKFKSLIVQNDPRALLTVAAYIDLNPVRAGFCRDPKEYRFCGYAEAVAGGAEARAGLSRLMENSDWREAARHYRMTLFGKGAVRDPSAEGGMDPEKARKVIEAGGRLSFRDLARCRIRYFSDGVALGSTEFVDRIRRVREEHAEPRHQGKPPPMPVEDEHWLHFARRQRSMPDTSP